MNLNAKFFFLSPWCLFHFSLYTILCTFNYIVYRKYSNFFVVSLIMQPIYPRAIYKILTGRSHPYNLSRLFASLYTLNNNKLCVHPVPIMYLCILYILPCISIILPLIFATGIILVKNKLFCDDMEIKKVNEEKIDH